MNANSLLASPTGLSPYLRFGCLSCRLFYYRLWDLYKKVRGREHTQTPPSTTHIASHPRKGPSYWLWGWSSEVLETLNSEKPEMVGFQEVTAVCNWVTDVSEPRFSYSFEDETEKLASGPLEVVHSLAADK